MKTVWVVNIRDDYYATDDIMIFAEKDDVMKIFNDVIEDNKDYPEFNADDYEATWENRGYFNSVTVWEEGVR